MISTRVTVIMPCFGRPGRTRRVLNCLSNQTMLNFEAFIIGDGCPDFQELLDSGDFVEWKAYMEGAGAVIHSFNLDRNYGGHGYYIRNYAIENAKSPYIVFVDNDDIIEPDHLEFYLSEIEGTDYGLVYYNTLVVPAGGIRDAQLRFAGIGHSELIIATKYAQVVPKQTSEYGHDWSFIKNILDLDIKVKKSTNPYKTTYHVMSTGPEKHRLDLDID